MAVPVVALIQRAGGIGGSREHGLTLSKVYPGTESTPSLK